MKGLTKIVAVYYLPDYLQYRAPCQQETLIVDSCSLLLPNYWQYRATLLFPANTSAVYEDTLPGRDSERASGAVVARPSPMREVLGSSPVRDKEFRVRMRRPNYLGLVTLTSFG
jgi:hypothetical protein